MTEEGLWWDEEPPKAKSQRRGQWHPMPTIPDTGWRVPAEFPNLTSAKIIGLDTETYDPELTDAGPGWARGRGHIVGVSLAVMDGSKWYFPVRHGIDENGAQQLPPEHAAMNMDAEQVIRFLRDTLGDTRPKVGANLIYDMGWLQWEGVQVGGRLYDVQFAEALINSETPSVSLEALADKYIGSGKQTEHLYEWLSHWNGKAANDKQRKWIYKTPPALAGPYAEADAALPIQILQKQWSILESYGQIELFELECRLIPLLVAMRMKGAPVDLDKADQVYDELGHRLVGIEQQLADLAGQPINPNAGESIAKSFNALSIPIPKVMDKKTGEMKVSFGAKLLEALDNPLANAILEHRRVAKVRNTFVKSYIIDKQINGRVYCSFHPLKSDDGGARSGRFSSSDPNLQNLPIRTDIGKLVRSCFVASPGGRWRSFDYSSIEYRLLAHFAVGPGADVLRAVFAADPYADYHQIVMDLIYRLTGIKLERTAVKNINFGIMYGMQLNALAAFLKLAKDKAKELLASYHEAAPYAKATMDACAAEVHDEGFVTTILNRRSYFPVWGPKGWQSGGRPRGMNYADAAEEYGKNNIERQMTHKALNRKLQGSAADVIKKAMVEGWDAGLFHDTACGVPILTVHDELDFEDMGDLDNPAWIELQRIMETSTPGLRIPLIVDSGIGASWIDAH